MRKTPNSVICLVLTVLVLPCSYVFAGTNGTHFYFAQITDTHLGSDNHNEVTRELVKIINQVPLTLEFVAHTGDIFADNIDDGKTMRAAKDIFKELGMPIYYVPGNHDIEADKIGPTIFQYTNQLGAVSHTVEVKGVVFVYVYTEPLRKGFEVDSFRPLRWLEEKLKSAGGKPVVVFHHAPSVGDFYRNKMHTGWKWEIRKEWERILNAYNVKAVIAGHFHRDEHHWLGGVPLYVAPPVAGYWGRQASFRVYEYNNGRLGYRTVYYGD